MCQIIKEFLALIIKAHIHNGTVGQNGVVLVNLSKGVSAKKIVKPDILLSGNIRAEA